jgi:hypothetical protein
VRAQKLLLCHFLLLREDGLLLNARGDLQMERSSSKTENQYSFVADKPYSFEDAIETASIRRELIKLANSGTLSKDASAACVQAAWLLMAMREVILSVPFEGYTFEEVKPAMDALKKIMTYQHD